MFVTNVKIHAGSVEERKVVNYDTKHVLITACVHFKKWIWLPVTAGQLVTQPDERNISLWNITATHKWQVPFLIFYWVFSGTDPQGHRTNGYKPDEVPAPKITVVPSCSGHNQGELFLFVFLSHVSQQYLSVISMYKKFVYFVKKPAFFFFKLSRLMYRTLLKR